MKLEMDYESAKTISIISGCATIAIICFLIYRYNCLPYEKGYTQKQLEASQMTIWTKP